MLGPPPPPKSPPIPPNPPQNRRHICPIMLEATYFPSGTRMGFRQSLTKGRSSATLPWTLLAPGQGRGLASSNTRLMKHHVAQHSTPHKGGGPEPSAHGLGRQDVELEQLLEHHWLGDLGACMHGRILDGAWALPYARLARAGKIGTCFACPNAVKPQSSCSRHACRPQEPNAELASPQRSTIQCITPCMAWLPLQLAASTHHTSPGRHSMRRRRAPELCSCSQGAGRAP